MLKRDHKARVALRKAAADWGANLTAPVVGRDLSSLRFDSRLMKAARAFVEAERMDEMVKFDTSREDAKTIQQIVDRAAKAELLSGSRMGLEMDLKAVHANGTPLRLAELLKADTFNFAHDVCGIQARIDRNTGGLRDHFLPRFCARQ